MFLKISVFSIIVIAILGMVYSILKSNNKKLHLGYLLYFLSFLIVFPISLPLYFILGFMADDPILSDFEINVMQYGFFALVTIIGSIILNIIYRKAIFLKNNRDTWTIVITHLFFIPLSIYLYSLV